MADQDEFEIQPSQQIDFVTLGMFIIDEIHYPPPKPPQYNVLGGAGSYSALGARILSPPPLSKTCGWIIDVGSDFPDALAPKILSWETSALIRNDPTRLTTRGWNGYTAETQYRQFKYTTPKLRLEAEDLLGAPALLNSKSFHLICNPQRCISLINNIRALRRNHLSHMGTPPPKPIFIWEPVPDSMLPEQLIHITAALGYVDVVSPNHAELGQLMGCTGELMDGSGRVDKEFVEEATEVLLGSLPLTGAAVVVRCGAEGCYIGQNGGRVSKRQPYAPKQTPADKKPLPGKVQQLKVGSRALTDDVDMFALLGGLTNDDLEARWNAPDSDEEENEPMGDFGLSTWIPAYHTDPSKVVDPTGGGNAFLGGMAVAYVRGDDIINAVKMGSIAASFAIEQAGMPVLVGKNENHVETWNGVVVQDRIREFERRLGGQPGSMDHLMEGVEDLALKPVGTPAN